MSKVAGSALLKELNSARSAATVVASGCHQLITPSPRFNRLLAPCPRRAQTAGDSRPIAGSSGWPRPAQSSGPPRWIARIKLVPKLTVRVRFPSPAPHAKSVAIHTNWAPSPIWIGIRRHQNSALVPLRVPLAMRDRLSAHRCECPDTLGTAWLKGVNMTEKLLDVSPTSRAFTSARCRHLGQVDVGGDHDRLDVASRLLLSVSAEMTNTGRRLAGRDPEGAPRSAQ